MIARVTTNNQYLPDQRPVCSPLVPYSGPTLGPSHTSWLLSLLFRAPYLFLPPGGARALYRALYRGPLHLLVAVIGLSGSIDDSQCTLGVRITCRREGREGKGSTLLDWVIEGSLCNQFGCTLGYSAKKVWEKINPPVSASVTEHCGALDAVSRYFFFKLKKKYINFSYWLCELTLKALAL